MPGNNQNNNDSRIAVLESNMEDSKKRYQSMEKKLDAILEQTTKTNGSVATLRRDVDDTYIKIDANTKKINAVQLQTVKAWAYVAGISSAVGVVGSIIGKFL